MRLCQARLLPLPLRCVHHPLDLGQLCKSPLRQDRRQARTRRRPTANATDVCLFYLCMQIDLSTASYLDVNTSKIHPK